MAVTIGHYEHKLDSKNRLAIPPKYREALIAEKGSHFTLALGIDDCITLFLPSQWENYLNSLNQEIRAYKNRSQARAIKRHIFQSAVEAPLDSQGRVLVPQNLKDHAKLTKDVVVTGVGDKAEIWDRKNWEKYHKTQAIPSFQKLAKDLDL